MARRSTPNIILHIAASKHSWVYLHLCLLVALKVIRIELGCNPVKALFDFGFCILSCMPYGLYLMYLMCYTPLWKLIDAIYFDTSVYSSMSDGQRKVAKMYHSVFPEYVTYWKRRAHVACRKFEIVDEESKYTMQRVIDVLKNIWNHYEKTKS